MVEVAEASGGGGGDLRSLGGGGGGGVALVGAARAAAAAKAAATASVVVVDETLLVGEIASLRDQPATMAERACTYGSDVIPVRPVRHAGSLRLRMVARGRRSPVGQWRGATTAASTNHEAAFACIVLPGGRTIGGGASPAFAAGCSFSIRESETRDCVGDRRAASYGGSKRVSAGSKTKCGRLFLPLGWFS